MYDLHLLSFIVLDFQIFLHRDVEAILKELWLLLTNFS